jgi:hypothetical protein
MAHKGCACEIFREAGIGGDYMSTAAERIEVFQDTMNWINSMIFIKSVRKDTLIFFH